MIPSIVVLLCCLIVGVVVHECAHALALRAFGIPHTMQFLPDRGPGGRLAVGLRGRWAMVTVDALPPTIAPWHLRVAALMPLALALPTVPILVGWVAMPIPSAYANLVLLAWLACAIPSPADFSMVWYPEETIAQVAASTP